ncbi:MAG: alanyl-tRNA editing protein [Chloroflexi bacterium]|nr:alanyl-tRNA editing protein [Chloroflexota bacterium]
MTTKLYRFDPYQSVCTAEVIDIQDGHLILNQTVFFGEAGGQIGDTGTINGVVIGDAQHSDGRMLIRQDLPTIKVGTDIKHFSDGSLDNLKIGDEVTATIDWERRYRIMRMHSAAHLVYYYSLKFFGDTKLQDYLRGCRIGDDSGRFDFAASDKLSPDDLTRIEDAANNLAAKSLDIHSDINPDEPDLVWWTCGEIGMYCGGTHVRNTSEIGTITVRRKSKGQGTERVYFEISG